MYMCVCVFRNKIINNNCYGVFLITVEKLSTSKFFNNP
jgi:hypothetical protein